MCSVQPMCTLPLPRHSLRRWAVPSTAGDGDSVDYNRSKIDRQVWFSVPTVD